jgi:hypothetical protein
MGICFIFMLFLKLDGIIFKFNYHKLNLRETMVNIVQIQSLCNEHKFYYTKIVLSNTKKKYAFKNRTNKF